MQNRRDRLSAAFIRYAEEARQRAAVIVANTVGDHTDNDALREIRLQAHSLAGTGASLGAYEISRVARDIEERTDQLLEQNRPATTADLRDLRSWAKELSQHTQAFDPESALTYFLENS